MAKKYNKSPVKLIVRGSIYHIIISTVVNGKRLFVRESSHTADKKQAQTYANQRFKQLIEEAEYRTNPNKLKEFTLDQAFGLFWQEKGQYHANADDTFNKLENLNKYFNKDLRLSELTIDDISRFVQLKRSEGRKIATVNRYLALISAILNLCKKHRVNTPDLCVRQFMKKEPIQYDKWYNPEQFWLIYENAAEHLKKLMKFDLITGFRCSNLFELKWSQIHDGFIFYTVKDKDYEGGRPETKEITPTMQEILDSIPKVSEYVFTYKGQPIKSIKKAWKRAIERAGVPYWGFHVIRHTHGTWLQQATKDDFLVQRSLNHKYKTTTERYIHATKTGNVNLYESVFCTKSPQNHETSL